MLGVGNSFIPADYVVNVETSSDLFCFSWKKCDGRLFRCCSITPPGNNGDDESLNSVIVVMFSREKCSHYNTQDGRTQTVFQNTCKTLWALIWAIHNIV